MVSLKYLYIYIESMIPFSHIVNFSHAKWDIAVQRYY